MPALCSSLTIKRVGRTTVEREGKPAGRTSSACRHAALLAAGALAAGTAVALAATHGRSVGGWQAGIDSSNRQRDEKAHTDQANDANAEGEFLAAGPIVECRDE